MLEGFLELQGLRGLHKRRRLLWMAELLAFLGLLELQTLQQGTVLQYCLVERSVHVQVAIRARSWELAQQQNKLARSE